jgi:hypothetical protein
VFQGPTFCVQLFAVEQTIFVIFFPPCRATKIGGKKLVLFFKRKAFVVSYGSDDRKQLNGKI